MRLHKEQGKELLHSRGDGVQPDACSEAEEWCDCELLWCCYFWCLKLVLLSGCNLSEDVRTPGVSFAVMK